MSGRIASPTSSPRTGPSRISGGIRHLAAVLCRAGRHEALGAHRRHRLLGDLCSHQLRFAWRGQPRPQAGGAGSGGQRDTVAGAVSLLLAGVAARWQRHAVAVTVFLTRYVLHHLRRPVTVALVSDQISHKVMAAVLSAESQLTTLLAAGLGPLWVGSQIGSASGLLSRSSAALWWGCPSCCAYVLCLSRPGVLIGSRASGHRAVPAPEGRVGEQLERGGGIGCWGQGRACHGRFERDWPGNC